MRFGHIKGLFTLFSNANMDIMDDKPETAAPVAKKVEPHAQNFQEKLAAYAAKGRYSGEIITDDNNGKYALKHAAAQGDTAFLKELAKRQPDIFENRSNILLKETLTQAIVHKHADTVRFLLDDIKVDPDFSDHSQSYKFPQWDALFVAATGVIPTNFRHEAGTDWGNETPADEKAVEIFNLVLSAYIHKYITDAFADKGETLGKELLEAIEQQFSLPDNNTYMVSDSRVSSTKSSYASTLTAARPNLAPILQTTVNSVRNKFIEPDALAPDTW